jgi:hypothetical protein
MEKCPFYEQKRLVVMTRQENFRMIFINPSTVSCLARSKGSISWIRDISVK